MQYDTIESVENLKIMVLPSNLHAKNTANNALWIATNLAKTAGQVKKLSKDNIQKGKTLKLYTGTPPFD